MDVVELRRELERLVAKYVTDARKREQCLHLVRKPCTPIVKAILAAISTSGTPIDPEDGALIKKIAFFFV